MFVSKMENQTGLYYFSYSIFFNLTACLSMIGWGCNIGWTAISGPQLSDGGTKGISDGDSGDPSNTTQPDNTILGNNDDLHLSHNEISWIGASFSIGGLCGALSAGNDTLLTY